jgi:aryl-alcohol dehydrogenase-like predicted oxidoreductase
VLSKVMPGLDTDAQRALQFVRSTPGVGTALVGMKSLAHVTQATVLAKVAPVRWSSFRKLFASA